MAQANSRASDRIAVLGAIDPDVYTASTVTTGWISAAEFARFQAIVMAGTLGSSATLDAKIEQATSSAGAGAKDLAGKAIGQLTQAGTNESDKQAIINFRAADLDLAGDFTHFRLSMTVGTATSDAGAIVLGIDPRELPASDNDAASVAEIV